MSYKFFKSGTFKIGFSVIIFIFSIFLIVKLVDFKFFWESLKHLKIEFLIFAIASLLVSYFFRVMRYEQLLNIKNKRKKLFSVSAIHYFLNKILPARSGEISFPLLLKKHLNYNYTNGISILFFARILDFFAMNFLLLISSFFIKSAVIKIQHIIILLILMIVGLLASVIVLNLL
ncbi:MAG: flippase-like domain-containing protein, partial [Bacteroidales bacterium]|nr:flippase-like domain-containing protein [Bacteroidales bacterium]